MVEYKLKEVLEEIVDYRGKTPKKLKSKWSEEGIPALSAKNIKQGLLVQKESINFGDVDLYRKWMDTDIKEGDILLTSEAPLGEAFYFDLPYKIILSQRLYALRPNRNIVYPKYLYAQIRSNTFQKKLVQKQSGTTVFGIRRPQLERVLIKLPDLNVQKDIGDLIYNVEKKIKTNNKIIDSLNEYKSNLFRKWFIDFDFPNSDGMGYYSSGGEMIETEGRSIPKNWKISKLKKFATYSNGISYSSEELTDNSQSGIPMINLASFNRSGGYSPKGMKYFSGDYKDGEIVSSGDLIIACTDLTKNQEIIGSPIIIPSLDNEKIVISMDLIKINLISDEVSIHFLNELFLTDKYKRYINGFTNGTNVVHLKKDAVINYKTVIPNKDTLKKSDIIFGKINNHISDLYNQNKLLEDLFNNYLIKNFR